MKNLFAATMLAVAVAGYAFAQDESGKLSTRISAAESVLRDLASVPDKGIPKAIAAKAQCVAVIPGFKKGAFLVGGEYGQGVATCRGSQGWSAPVFIQLTGASFGFQAGGQSTDLVLVGETRNSLNDLLKDKVKLGGDIAVSAGPLGRDSEAATTELVNAEFLTYSRSKGLFAGVDLNGDEIHQNSKDTTAFYGADISFEKILSGAVSTPGSAGRFVATVNKLFK